MTLNKNKVAVGLSGGVDSTVTAYLLKKKGYEVIGVTMLLFDEYDSKGCLKEPIFIDNARRIAKLLEIPYYIVDFRNEFKQMVINEFVNEYLSGRTPNPCVKCNKTIKMANSLKQHMS